MYAPAAWDGPASYHDDWSSRKRPHGQDSADQWPADAQANYGGKGSQGSGGQEGEWEWVNDSPWQGWQGNGTQDVQQGDGKKGGDGKGGTKKKRFGKRRQQEEEE